MKRSLITPPSSAGNSIHSRSPTPPESSMSGHSSSGSKKHHESSSRSHGSRSSSQKDSTKESQFQGHSSSSSSHKHSGRSSAGHKSSKSQRSSENTGSSSSPSSKSKSSSSRHSHEKKSKSLPSPRSESSSLAEASLAAATAAAEATEAADGFYGENGEYYGGEYYSDYASSYYRNHYYYGHNGPTGAAGDGGEVEEDGGDEGNDEDLDGHELMTRLAPGLHLRPVDGEGEAADGDVHGHSHQDTDSDECYPSSVSSAIRAHHYEAGMRYHAFHGSGGDDGGGLSTNRGGRLYALPNDDIEQNRDDMKHAMTMLLMDGQQYYAPVHDKLVAGAEVCDLGTGTGIWAIELADKYPNSAIRGVDLSPIQPNLVPDNLFFCVDDFEDDWVHQPNQFDYIHMRHSLFAVEDRPALLKKIFRHLKPGGYVEFQELQPVVLCDDNTLTDSTPYALRDFLRYVGHGMMQSPALAGGDLMADQSQSHARRKPLTDVLSSELRAAGFRGVRTKTHKCPLGTWPRERLMRGCGLLARTTLMDGLRGWASRPLGNTAGGLGWTQMQIEVFLVDVRKAVMDSSVHAYFPMHVVYAQKPKA